MELVGQAVPDGDAGVLCELLDLGLLEATVLDAVEHAAEDAGGVGDGLLVAHLGAAGVKVGAAHAEVIRANLEGAAGTSGGLLEEKGDVLALEVAVGNAGALHVLEVGGEVQEVVDLLGGEVQELQEVTATKIDAHVVPFYICTPVRVLMGVQADRTYECRGRRGVPGLANAS